jgi:hypothetical protein
LAEASANLALTASLSGSILLANFKLFTFTSQTRKRTR